MQISALSPSPNFHSWKSYVKKIIVFKKNTKIEKFELKLVNVAILGTDLL